jgi:hypothetical protein
MGQPDGGSLDETFELGIIHQWAALGMRAQGSPIFVDINPDGRLDILARRGLPTSFGFGSFFAEGASDLIYLQAEDGSFERLKTAEETVPSTGIRFTVGDLDRDGRPGVARDGAQGSLYVWSPPPLSDTTRALTVSLVPTVSGKPAIGAMIHGTWGVCTHHAPPDFRRANGDRQLAGIPPRMA